jgi:hypothetical protein
MKHVECCFQDKFEKLVHPVGFIVKKTVFNIRKGQGLTGNKFLSYVYYATA